MIKIPDFNPIEYLAERKYPGQSIGREDSILGYHHSEEIVKRLKSTHEKADKYKLSLKKMSNDELDKLVEEEKIKADKELRIKINVTEQNRFFNKIEANADYEYWSKATYWTLDEAIALSFGKDPKVVYWDSVKHYVGLKSYYIDNGIGKKFGKSDAMTYQSHFADEYSRLRELVTRAKNFQKLFDPILPILFINWMKEYGLDFPSKLEELVTKYNNASLDWKKLYEEAEEKHNGNYDKLNKCIEKWERVSSKKEEIIKELNQKMSLLKENISNEFKIEKPLNKKVQDSLLKLFIGMVATSYGDEEAHSVKASEISDDIYRNTGLSIDEDTVRKYLNQARKLLPELETEQN